MIEKSGYPPEIVSKHVLQALEQIEKSTTSPLSGGNQDTTKSSASPDYVLKIPYINEGFTRKVSATVKKTGINARIVTQAGRSVRSHINIDKVNTCKCKLCNTGIDCATRHFVYQASCNKCGDQYIGASRRPILNRIQEHESSVRINNARTTLGQHAARHRHDDSTVYVPTTGTRNFNSFFKQYSFDVVKKCKDTLETFINEGMLITSTKPKLNNMLRNGFTE